jgi:hypothetical protein
VATSDNLKADSIVLAEYDKRRWLVRNRGVFAAVARQLSKKKRCSKQFVRLVFWNQRTSARVERVLRRMRAPGFEPGGKKMAAG